MIRHTMQFVCNTKGCDNYAPAEQHIFDIRQPQYRNGFTGNYATTLDGIRSAAKKNAIKEGWLIRHDKHLCPTCHVKLELPRIRKAAAELRDLCEEVATQPIHRPTEGEPTT